MTKWKRIRIGDLSCRHLGKYIKRNEWPKPLRLWSVEHGHVDLMKGEYYSRIVAMGSSDDDIYADAWYPRMDHILIRM